MVVMCIVTALFSVTLYFNISSDIKESLSHSLPHGIDPDHFFEDQNNHVLNVLLLVDGIILVVSGAMSYSFAGYTLKPIKSAMQAQERFAADAAHELRTPLTVIQTQIEVLLRSQGPVPQKTRETLVSVLEEIQHLSGVTKDLLLSARRQEEAPSYPLAVVPISEIIADTVLEFRPIAEKKKIQIVVTGPENRIALAEKDGIKRVLINLITNAIKYTPEDGHISIEVADEGQHLLRVSIKDDGQGISSADLPHIFERFYKADNARHSGGTGLGLSIVKELVDSYGGSIDVTSTLGHGTTVNVRLKKPQETEEI